MPRPAERDRMDATGVGEDVETENLFNPAGREVVPIHGGAQQRRFRQNGPTKDDGSGLARGLPNAEHVALVPGVQKRAVVVGRDADHA